MKFGHLFAQRLQQDGFPPAWVDSAISYHQLKKCIHRLENELASLGLAPDTLKQLLRDVEDLNARTELEATSDEHDHKPFEYILSSPKARAAHATREAANSEGKGPYKVFHPKLLFTVNAITGEPLAAHLSPETKAKLHQLALEHGMSEVRVTEVSEPDQDRPQNCSTASSGTDLSQGHVRMIEVPLTSDSEFFSMLTTQLSGIASLQSEEHQRLYDVISGLSKSLNSIIEANPGKKREIKDIVRWRRILNAYVDCNIFFETKPNNRVVAHDVTQAETQLQKFTRIITEEKLAIKFKSKESQEAASLFFKINQDLLQNLRFQALNNLAMIKILKKFDKRTALGVKSTFPQNVQIPVFTNDIAKAICYQVTKDIVEAVPRIEDYECPVCSWIAWRPVKLACGHIFCIRCLIVLQSRKQDHCPLCRGNVVMEAYAANISDEHMKIMATWFPDEVKAKQKDNEFLAGVDQYGEAYKTKCAVM